MIIIDLYNKQEIYMYATHDLPYLTNEKHSAVFQLISKVINVCADKRVKSQNQWTYFNGNSYNS